MNREEWIEIVEWIGDRFTRPWTQKQIEAFYFDLRSFTFGSVKESIHALYNKGLTRPPNGSEILSLVKQISKDQETEKVSMDDCRHLPVDDEGYCTACGGFPKLRKLYENSTDLELSQISADSPQKRELLPTVLGEPPDEQPHAF